MPKFMRRTSIDGWIISISMFGILPVAVFVSPLRLKTCSVFISTVSRNDFVSCLHMIYIVSSQIQKLFQFLLIHLVPEF